MNDQKISLVALIQVLLENNRSGLKIEIIVLNPTNLLIFNRRRVKTQDSGALLYDIKEHSVKYSSRVWRNNIESYTNRLNIQNGIKK